MLKGLSRLAGPPIRFARVSAREGLACRNRISAASRTSWLAREYSRGILRCILFADLKEKTKFYNIFTKRSERCCFMEGIAGWMEWTDIKLSLAEIYEKIWSWKQLMQMYERAQ